MALQGCLHRCCSPPTARAAPGESSEPRLWDSHSSEGARMAGDSIRSLSDPCSLPSCQQMIWLFSSSQVTSSPGSSPRSSRQQTAFQARKMWLHQAAAVRPTSSSLLCHQVLWAVRECPCSDSSAEKRREVLLHPSFRPAVLEDPPSSTSSRLEIPLFCSAACIATANRPSLAAFWLS